MTRRRNRDDAVARCHEVGRVLQSYLDGFVDDVTARRVALHLEACRRCGLELRAYRLLKAALVRRTTDVDQLAVQRVRAFALRLLENPPAATGPAG